MGASALELHCIGFYHTDKTLHGTGSSIIRACGHLIEQFDSLEQSVSDQMPLLRGLCIVRIRLKRDSQITCLTCLDVSSIELVRDVVRTVHGQTPKASKIPQRAKTRQQRSIDTLSDIVNFQLVVDVLSIPTEAGLSRTI